MKMTVEELLRRYAAGERDFAETDFRYEFELSVAILRDINLERAYMSDMNIIGVDLTGANMSGLRFEEGLLQDVNLTGANLRNFLLFQGVMESVNLTSADLTSADLTGTQLRKVNLTGATLIEAKLSGASFSDCNLSNVVMELTNGPGTFFRNTIMPDGSIRNS
jgi:uncharacterized protein YjbI with pentapeptide repeats